MTLFGSDDLASDRDRHDVIFSCSSGCARPADPELFERWSASRTSRQPHSSDA